MCYRTSEENRVHACGGMFVSDHENSYKVKCKHAEMLKMNVNFGAKDYTVVNVYVRDGEKIKDLTEYACNESYCSWLF